MSSPSSKSAPAVDQKLSRQGQRSRAALVRAARRVFEKRGYHETRIADVTTAARMAVGSFYTYFDSKEDLFEAVLIEMENLVYEDPARTARDGLTPLQRIRATNEVYLTTYQKNARFWAVIEQATLRNPKARQIQAARHAESRARTMRALAAWQAQGLIDPAIDLPFVSECLGAMTERCAYLWFVMGEPVEMPAAIDKITRVWGDALGLRE